ncbi:hypothetical protein Asulf_00525 [Archaeoglobus sulfaticallidus PM70-1]|uniref:GTPase n=1 Tax=Archaeoglobus sulfaticallidus PM70-1 TaxID=387631 RepID=N0BC43_9EURY|nr:ATP/GTP-binding protein [Archaeoglobus sulfaticallidus]AGK60548.1 hypothetical protein Asulf_00525 [Archaeoglobus sulfaticallidus PM70-1]
MIQVLIYFIGTAGSGKTYLTKAFADWLDFKNLENIIVNLDPGAENLPYSPEVDIRDYFTLEDVMLNYGVGPNGAQIISADLISTKIGDIKDEIDYFDVPYVLIDTPGQMELFTLRQSSNLLIDFLGRDRSVMVYLFDPVVAKTPSGFLSLLFMASSSVFKLKLPQIQVLAKSDILEDYEVERIVEWSDDPETLFDDLGREVSNIKNISGELFYMLRDLGLFRTLIPVSAMDSTGMEDVYDGIQEIFYGGEDLERILY